MGKTLTSVIRYNYPSDVQSRGDNYFNSDAVHVEHVGGTSIHATVQGQQRYGTDFDWSGPDIIAYCDCPFFEGAGFCKHLWATALAYDSSGMVPVRLSGKIQVASADDIDDWKAQGYRQERGLTGLLGLGTPARRSRSEPPPTPHWKRLLTTLYESPLARRPLFRPSAWTADSELIYLLNVPRTLGTSELILHILQRTRKKNGTWGASKPRSLSREIMDELPDPVDRQIAARLLGAHGQSFGFYAYDDPRTSSFTLPDALADALIPLLCGSGRCFLGIGPDENLPPLRFDDEGPWELRLDVRADDTRTHYILSGSLYRQPHREPLTSPTMLTASGWVFWPDRVARLLHHNAFPWILMLRQQKEIHVPLQQADELLERLLRAPFVPPMDLPDDLQYHELRATPRPCLRIRKPDSHWNRDMLPADLSFDYDGHRIEASSPQRGLYLKESRQLFLRDLPLEEAATEKLRSLGLRCDSALSVEHMQLPSKLLPRVVASLVAENWNVEADGALYRRADGFHVAVSSGIDWFELHGQADFGGVTASLPQLLAALKKGEQLVHLDDGSLGVLPEEWLRKFGLLANVATTENDHLRFKPTQAGFLDALLATQPQATCDETFSRLREQLRRFERIEPLDAPPTFVGTLRPYQRDGLGWLHFLQRFGFGGCLADDMGLGKTVQVLALLESRRLLRADQSSNGDRPAPSLVVVPRSLIFNWRQEAARFTPSLRVLDHSGTARRKDSTDHFDDHDLILTTYGTLRRDAAHLKDVLFDYVIFDESQSIKNASSASVKAARLLQARHRLCMSGTPIENHLGELWSQFEVLNPGMLGASSALASGANGKAGSEDSSRELLARVLRPFILRRTKSQVAADLPEKTEQTLYCDLEGTQRNQYDELRDHYRQALLARVTRDGLNKSKIQILEALLRLRQAAIHPGLIDKAQSAESSAKLETLLPLLRETIAEGHKALVFSQFTSMLSIVRSRLDSEHIPYEYLDGRTRDRQSRVEHFQNDPQCPLFLISLKAGGLGLNLTAAEYVFLLDPWWNPAVEAQAIDRAHRIGQHRQVFAYRLIARDTVEDRILELQQSKRDLADAIINADNSLIRDLSREDLELLLR